MDSLSDYPREEVSSPLEIISMKNNSLKWFINKNLLWISLLGEPDQDPFYITKSIEFAKMCADQRNIMMVATNYSSDKHLSYYLDAGFIHTCPEDPQSHGLYWLTKGAKPP